MPTATSWLDQWRPRLSVDPFQHQIIGVSELLQRPYLALFDDPGIGKSFQVVVAASLLFVTGKIDTVLVVAPSSVRNVWLDRHEGQIAVHTPQGIGFEAIEFHREVVVKHARGEGKRLTWVVTNYEYIRQDRRRDELLGWLKKKRALIVSDEGAYIKSHRTQQYKAMLKLRDSCPRAVLLNGTPIGNNLADLFTQMRFLHQSVLGFNTFFGFRTRYCIMGGYQGKQIVGYQHADELITKVGRHSLRRTKDQCLDLPAKIYQTITIPLSKETWRFYCQMRDEMVTWLSDSSPSTASQAVVKMIRLSQLTSGILGGVEDELSGAPKAVIVSHEKMNWLKSWILDQLEEDQNLKLIIWCRFRIEQELLAQQLSGKIPVSRIFGGQNGAQRDDDVRKFTGPGPCVLLGQPQAGGFGLNLQVCHRVVYLSHDYSLLTRIQSEDRVHRPGQRYQATYYNVVATGPNGEKTIDHTVVKAQQKKEELSDWATARWISELKST